MKFISVSLLFLFCSIEVAMAQHDGLVVTPLKSNPALYYQSRKYNSAVSTPSNARSLPDVANNYIVNSDTLSLPFIDDFSSNRTREFDFLNHIYDSVINAMGPCIDNAGYNTISGRFMQHQSYQYTFDNVTHHLDSIPKVGILFQNYGLFNSCLDGPPAPFTYYPPYYVWQLDSTGTYVKDSFLVQNTDLINPDTNINYVPKMYLVKLSKNTLWTDNYAYINNTFPVNPPTIGVATLDGLNQYGRPYDNSTPTAYGIADYLTSKPIDLSALYDTDKVYLSFFYQSQGNGDFPDATDSLIVEMKDQTGQWNEVWGIPGDSVDPQGVIPPFQQVFIKVDSFPAHILSYFHPTFQFRFKNYATLAGNNDHWNIDYVRLYAHRDTVADKYVNDIAFQYPFPSILKNYELMPSKQFMGASDLADTITLQVSNNNNPGGGTPATNFFINGTETYPNTNTLYNPTVQTFNAGPTQLLTLNPKVNYSVPSGDIGGDSLNIRSIVYITPTDNFHPNDTIVRDQVFSDVLAYDDGSAEHAIGMQGISLKKFAYEFDLNKPDTLAAFQVFYSDIKDDVSNLVFTFNLWNRLVLNDYTFIDTPIYTSNNVKPLYIDSTNGFTTYRLDNPIVVSGKLYFGWSQTDDRNLQIGLDVNSLKGNNKVFMYAYGLWNQASLPISGSPMIRLILNGHYTGQSSIGIAELAQGSGTMVVFPNPANEQLHVRLPNGVSTANAYELYDAIGSLVSSGFIKQSAIDIASLTNGFYQLRVLDSNTNRWYPSKFIKAGY